MTIQIHTNLAAIKPRLLQIYKKYKTNAYYIDNPKLFAFLVILTEDFPKTYSAEIDNNQQNILVKTWIQRLFEIENAEIVNKFTTEDKVRLILNNVIELPVCKCKAKLQKFSS